MDSQNGKTATTLICSLPAGMLVDLLSALGDGPAVLRAVLRLSIVAANAERGLAFDSAGGVAVLGFADREAGALRKELSALKRDGMSCYYRQEPAAGAERLPAMGMARAIEAGKLLFVFAVQRAAHGFCAEERERLKGLLHLMRHPLGQTVQLARLRQLATNASRKILPKELPLKRLNTLPQLEELEKMLIQEALKRHKNNKTRAAVVLGMTREGLRKKMLRLGVA